MTKRIWVEEGDVVVAENSAGEKRRFPQSIANASEWLGVDPEEAMTIMDESDDYTATWQDN